jgi:MYXO-CTERM domain-containing protein
MSGSSGTGGSGGDGLGGGGAEEPIGVAQEAEEACCCSGGPDGSMMSCSPAPSPADCPPYTTNTPGACGSDTGAGHCSSSNVGSGAGGAVEVFVLLLALAAFRAIRRRFA